MTGSTDDYTSEQDELRVLMQRADGTPWGNACSELWAEAAQLAVDSERLDEALICHLELTTAYCMDGRNYRCIAPFSYVEELRASHPELFTSELQHKHAWNMKYVISAVAHNPEVPVAQYRALLNLMESYYTELGDPGRAVSMRKIGFLRMTGEADIDEEFERWLGLPDSELADCDGCSPEQAVEIYASRGEWQKAREVGELALPDSENACSSQPEGLLTEMLEPWLRTGADDRAWSAHVRAYRRYRREASELSRHADHIRYLALSGAAGRPERLQRAETILLRHLPWWTRAEDHSDLRNLSAAAIVLIDRLPGSTDRVLEATLPGEDLQWIDGIETINRPTLAQAREWFMKVATTVAQLFDARPGMEHSIHVQTLEQHLNPEPVADLPARESGHITDVSGMFTPDTTDYQVISASAPSAPEAGQSGSDTTNAAVQNADDDEPPVVPIDLSGQWRTLSLAEALAENEALGHDIETVYWHHAVHLLIDNPQWRQSLERANVPEELASAWRSAVQDADVFLGTDMDFTSDDVFGTTTDPAYQLIEDAAAHLADGRTMEGCQAADAAMRTKSAEPIGVRLAALSFLSTGAKQAGYLDEGIDCARQRLNLSVAAELPTVTRQAAMELADLLLAADRAHEAAEVVEAALMALSAYRRSRAELDLRFRLTQANEALGYDDAAAEELLLIADFWAERGNGYQQLVALQKAARAYAEAQEFRPAVATWHRAIALAEQLWKAAEDPEDVENFRNAYATALFQCCATAVSQPGYVGDADMDVVEKLMDRLRELVNDPDHPGPNTAQWREADWLCDRANMYLYALRYGPAVDYAKAAADGFSQLDEPSIPDQARALMVASDAYFYSDQHAAALEVAQTVVELLKPKRFYSHPLRRQAMQRIREVGESE